MTTFVLSLAVGTLVSLGIRYALKHRRSGTRMVAIGSRQARRRAARNMAWTALQRVRARG